MSTASPRQAEAIELFDPMSPATLKSPFASYISLRDHYPVAYLEPVNVWAVSRHDDVRRILAAPDAFSAALAFAKDSSLTDARQPGERQLNFGFAGDSGAVISSADGDVHARLRRMVARLLAKPQLDAVDAAIAAHVRETLTVLAAQGCEFDAVAELAKPVAAKAIGYLMGLGEELTRTLASWVDLTFRALDPGDELSTLVSGQQVMRRNLSSFRAVTTFLNSTPDEGLAGVWRATATPAAREEVILSILQLFQAGYETIVSGIGFILDQLVVGQPETLASFKDQSSLHLVIDEGLRLASPVRATFRVAVGSQEIGASTVPDGAMVMVLLGSANRDERVFADPDHVRPDRPTAHLGFGAGPHRCLGRALAQVELRQILSGLMNAAKGITAAGPALVSANILKASYDSLPVTVDWRARPLLSEG